MKFSDKIEIDPSSITDTQSYKLLSGIIVPRPVAWVSTIGRNGVFNAAPFSFFTGISMNPPTLGFSIVLRNGRKKDTLKNLEYTRDFVVNVVTAELAEKMNDTAVDFPGDVDEMEVIGLTAAPSDKVRSPRIAESPVNMECKLKKIMIFGKSRERFVIGEVVKFHVAKEIMSDYKMDFSKLDAIGRLAGNSYCSTTEMYDIRRLTYEEWKDRG